MTREDFLNCADTYLILGDLDKPFHLPECECVYCEGWREENGRPTHRELRGRKDNSRGAERQPPADEGSVE